MYINGEWIVQKEKTFPVFNPATGEKIGEVADGNGEDTNTAIEAAHTAFQSWSRTTAYQRSRYMYDAYRIMVEHKEHLARTMTEEQGKPLKAARNEVQYGADFLLWFAEEAKRVYGETIPAPWWGPKPWKKSSGRWRMLWKKAPNSSLAGNASLKTAWTKAISTPRPF